MPKVREADVRRWLLMLLARMPVTVGVDEADAKVKMMTPVFARNYIADAFCESALEHVVNSTRFFHEGEIRLALDGWCKANNPDKSGLPTEASHAPLDADGKQWAAMFFRADSDLDAGRAIGLIVERHPRCFAWLLETQARARDLAARRGLTRPRDLRDEWADPVSVAAAVRSCLGQHLNGADSNPNALQVAKSLSTLRALVERHAPQNLPLIPTTEDLTGSMP